MLYVELTGKTIENKELWDLDDKIIALDLPFDWQPLLGMFFYYISFSTDDKDAVETVMNKVYDGEWKFIAKEDMLDYKKELDKFFNQ